MLETMNCIRMGEVLFDENQQLIILCNNCHTDLRNLQDFRHHLEQCEGLENLFHQGRQHLKYNTDKCTQLFGKTLKGIKEFLIYDYNDVEVTYTSREENFIDLINIEEELLDPKWYSDLNVDVSNQSSQKSSKKYDELVEAVTPFVQFKENFKNNNNDCRNVTNFNIIKSTNDLKLAVPETEKSIKTVKFDLTSSKIRPTAKRKLPVSKTLPLQFAVPASPVETSTTDCIGKKCKSDSTANGFVKPAEIKPVTIKTRNTDNMPSSTVLPSNIANAMTNKPSTLPIQTINQEPTKEKQTAQILNKLQNLGLQVKRTQSLPQPAAPNSSAHNKTDTKTLEILQRLQSKGMKVKILNKQQATETNIKFAFANPSQGLVPNPAHKTIRVLRKTAENATIKQNLNKNLIIKKVN